MSLISRVESVRGRGVRAFPCPNRISGRSRTSISAEMQPVAEEQPFHDLIRRVRSGNPEAARELVDRYGPHIRRVARFELRDARLRRLVDSEDVWQSVAAAFFVRAAVGEFELESPRDLLSLLSTMARNRARRHAEHEGAAKRDFRRSEPLDTSACDVAARGPTPSSVASYREMRVRFLERLSEEERLIAELRAEGFTWPEVADRLGDDPFHSAIREGRELSLDQAAR